MAKVRSCRKCKWRKNKVEPCCWCNRLHKGAKNDHYISVERELGEFLKEKGMI